MKELSLGYIISSLEEMKEIMNKSGDVMDQNKLKIQFNCNDFWAMDKSEYTIRDIAMVNGNSFPFLLLLVVGYLLVGLQKYLLLMGKNKKVNGFKGNFLGWRLRKVNLAFMCLGVILSSFCWLQLINVKLSNAMLEGVESLLILCSVLTITFRVFEYILEYGILLSLVLSLIVGPVSFTFLILSWHYQTYTFIILYFGLVNVVFAVLHLLSLPGRLFCSLIRCKCAKKCFVFNMWYFIAELIGLAMVIIHFIPKDIIATEFNVELRVLNETIMPIIYGCVGCVYLLFTYIGVYHGISSEVDTLKQVVVAEEPKTEEVVADEKKEEEPKKEEVVADEQQKEDKPVVEKAVKPKQD